MSCLARAPIKDFNTSVIIERQYQIPLVSNQGSGPEHPQFMQPGTTWISESWWASPESAEPAWWSEEAQGLRQLEAVCI